MGFGDKLKDLRKQAQEAVAEHKEQIQGAVEAVSVAANEKTGGKYTNKIAKFGEKAGSAVDKFGTSEGASDEAASGADTTASSAAVDPTASPEATAPAPTGFQPPAATSCASWI